MADALAASGSRERPPVLRGRHDFPEISGRIGSIVLQGRLPRYFWAAFFLCFLGVLLMLFSVTWLVSVGVGALGVNVPVVWGTMISNFVWWIGIGHAGTLISAVLLLLRQPWRASINRFAEAMTLFAVAMAGLFPILHLGRPWFFYWLVPYPNAMELWPQWRSALVWDIFAISTYLIVSLLFWYSGLIPDLATLRDRASSRVKRLVYGLLALGWRGEARHWARFETAYLLLAGLATPLVVSVHSVVSLDFAIDIVPGYHSTVFPPYFVGGALFSGFAMALTLAIPLRHFFGLQEFITARHLENSAKILLACGWIVAYGYFIETFTAYYSGEPFAIAMLEDRMFGFYAPLYWLVLACNVVIPQVLWWWRARRSVWLLFAISLAVNLGMWTERVMIVVQSMHRDFMPSAWGNFIPTAWDWTHLLGSIAFFVFLFLLFVRFLPAISISEMRKLVHEDKAQ
jgi:molybdopterin-containing oxidoreductase family membrane subunit